MSTALDPPRKDWYPRQVKDYSEQQPVLEDFRNEMERYWGSDAGAGKGRFALGIPAPNSVRKSGLAPYSIKVAMAVKNANS